MGTKELLYTEKKIHFKEGTVIFKEQEEGGKEMYFIDSGRVQIVKKLEIPKQHWRYLMQVISLER